MERFKKKTLLVWAAQLLLAICLVYSLFYIAANMGVSLFVFSNISPLNVSGILSGPLNVAVWGIAILALISGLAYDIERNMVWGYYRLPLALILLIALANSAVGFISVALGLIGAVALIPVSALLVGISVVFSDNLFKMGSAAFFLRMLLGSAVISVFAELTVFLL